MMNLRDSMRKPEHHQAPRGASNGGSGVPATQIAYGYVSGNPELQEFAKYPVPVPKDNEVLLKVEAAGLCMSDPHVLISGPIAKPGHPVAEKFVMGHEIAGQIVSTGTNLKSDARYAIGGRFALTIAAACGVCDSCRTGHDNICNANIEAYGLNIDGGFQQYLLVKNLRTLLPIPDNVSYAVAAVTSDSVLTPYHAIQKVRHLLQPTSKVLVVGAGGLGLNGIQILKNYGCKIVVTDVKAELESLALENGASEFYTDITETENHDVESFDVVIDFVGIQPTSDVCQAYVKNQGKYLTVGLGRSKLFLMNYQLARREVEVIFSFGGSSQEQIDCMNWVAQGKLKPLAKSVKLAELPFYLKQLVDGKVQGRIVFEPHAKL